MTEVIRADELLLNQVIKGDVAKVREMLEVGRAQVNAKCQYMTSPLHWAATYDLPEMCQLLLEKGASVNSTAIDGCTPLHFAARESSPAAASVLLQHGADARKKNNSGSLPIQLLWDDDEDVDIVEMLCKAGGGYPPGTSPAELEQQEQQQRALPSTNSASTAPKKQVASAMGSTDLEDGCVARVIEATVIESRTVRSGPPGGKPPRTPTPSSAPVDPVVPGMHCMAISTDTDFPWDEEEGSSGVTVSVVFNGSTTTAATATASSGTSTCDM
mmetsp:Transcript_33697/g.95337  ORF Transcript_33697/g.95337 Transcript_33697/m.95337 type:complete len:272 (-) Transcript_33697:2312-3127(-)